MVFIPEFTEHKFIEYCTYGLSQTKPNPTVQDTVMKDIENG